MQTNTVVMISWI